MPILLAQLLAQGLGLIGNAVLNKGKEAVEQKLGVDLDTALQTPDGRQQLLQLQVDNEQFLITSAIEGRKVDLEVARLEVANTVSAREMNTKVSESASASWLTKNIVPTLALIVVIGGGYAIWRSPDTDVRMAMVGIVTLVLGFYFGSSSSSKSKDATIENLSVPTSASGESK